MNDLNTLLSSAIRAAIDGGKAIMEIYEGPFDVQSKDDKSPLTEADLKANAIINEHLQTHPIPIISEENKQIEYQVRKSWNICWIVDPLDGTKEFVKRNGEFTVNIALVSEGKPILGVIYVPVSQTLYYALVEDNMAYKIVLDNQDIEVEQIRSDARPIQPANAKDAVVRVVGSRSHMNQETLDFIEVIKNDGREVEIVSRGSSLKFCLIAEGEADVYPRFAPTMEWDTAAGQAICHAAGADVYSQATKKLLDYNKENLLNPFFLVKARNFEIEF